jgi:hypothetical protein
MPNLPSGTVTFLFSDIEGSTSLLKQLGDEQYSELLRTHRRIVRETFAHITARRSTPRETRSSIRFTELARRWPPL